jgi:hypothetical protein
MRAFAQGRNMDSANKGVKSALGTISQIVDEGGGALPLCKLVGIILGILLLAWWLFAR